MDQAIATNIWENNPVSTIIQRIHFKHTTKGLRSLSVLSEKRSEGKTTIAVLLARGLAEIYNLKILLIDINPTGDPLLNQYLKEYEHKKNQDGMVLGHPFNFSIFRIKNIDLNWLKNAYDGLYTNQMVNTFSSEYDVVIVDTMTCVSTTDDTYRVNTHSNIIVSTEKSLGRKIGKLQTELEQNRKDVLGVIYNK